MNIVLGISGSIAAYKAADLASQLVKLGHEVHVVMTRSAVEFITPLTLQTLTRQPVLVSLEDEKQSWKPGHIELADRADLLARRACHREHARELRQRPRARHAFLDLPRPAAHHPGPHRSGHERENVAAPRHPAESRATHRRRLHLRRPGGRGSRLRLRRHRPPRTGGGNSGGLLRSCRTEGFEKIPHATRRLGDPAQGRPDSLSPVPSSPDVSASFMTRSPTRSRRSISPG